MSEYQYYEFLAIDRPLDAEARKALRALSSRALITARRFTNHYEWGDFRGDPTVLMERWFDLHLYRANWGTRRLMIRLPARLVDRARLDAFLGGADRVEVSTCGDDLIVDICRTDIDLDADDFGDDFGDDSGRLAALAPLREEAISGDWRLFYLVWLAAVEEESIGDDASEPLAGIGPLDDALDAFAEFFAIDPDLVAAAAEQCDPGVTGLSSDAARQTLAGIPEAEKTGILARLVAGEPHGLAELRGRVRAAGAPTPTPTPTGRRTAGNLRARRDAIRRAREQAAARRLAAEQARAQQTAERIRRARLEALQARGDAVWQDIETEIERRNAKGYAAAVALLLDLEALARERGDHADFSRRRDDLRARHSRKPAFLARLDRPTPG